MSTSTIWVTSYAWRNRITRWSCDEFVWWDRVLLTSWTDPRVLRNVHLCEVSGFLSWRNRTTSLASSAKWVASCLRNRTTGFSFCLASSGLNLLLIGLSWWRLLPSASTRIALAHGIEPKLNLSSTRKFPPRFFKYLKKILMFTTPCKVWMEIIGNSECSQ